MNIRLLRKAICGFTLSAALFSFHSVVSHGRSSIVKPPARLCLKSQKTLLDTVSTTCGSGWVNLQNSKTHSNIARSASTHPLPQVVLTVSKCNSRLLRQSSPAPAQQTKRYKVYCVDGKVSISEHELDEMKASRGSRVCLLESFDSLAEAMKAAKRYGGTRANCSCP